MDIQATISKLQSDIKQMSGLINETENEVKYYLRIAKEYEDVTTYWKYYHGYKDTVKYLVKQQKIDKSLYKLMCKIQKQMPNGNISMAQIREM
jgi:hypothetical protein